MLHVEIEHQGRKLDHQDGEGYRTWPQILRPVNRSGQGQRPSPLGHALRDGLLMAGRILDAGAVAAAARLPSLIFPGAEIGFPPMEVAVAALAAMQMLQLAGAYDHDEGYGAIRPLMLDLLLVPMAVAATLALFGHLGFASALWAVTAGMLAALLRLGWGKALDGMARSNGAARRVLVVGDRRRALEVLSLLAGDRRFWAFPVGVLVDRDPPQRPLLGGFISSIDDAERVVHDEQVDDIVVTLPWTDTDRLAACLQHLKPLAVDVHLFPETPEPFVDASGVSVLAGVPMVRIDSRPLAGWRLIGKAIEDRLLGAIILLLLAPVMLAVAIAIRLDSPGPVLFRQKRYGYDNRPFTCFKFRSMHTAPLPPAGEHMDRQATRDDPRITRVGRFIRRTSLDELPQLFNVLNGTMSLVGPRPHAVSHHHHYTKLVDDYRCRHRMKPGVTGWAQVSGFRGETATVELMRKRVLHDLWYIDHWSLWLDVVILARTPVACLKGTNAY